MTVSELDDVFSFVNFIKEPDNMVPTSNDRFLTSGKPTNELVLHLCQKQFETINIIIANKNSSEKMPRWNPFQLRNYMKQKIAEHPNITNMKYTRQGKLLFSTSDPVCAAKLLTLQNVLDTPVSTDVIWENISSRFLIPDIPTKKEKLAEELSCNNAIVISHMRRFVKPNSSQETSPVLVTILGIYLSDSMKIWFINQKIQPFNRQASAMY
ncbi:hypothetical protein AVEN_132151-1 [Araneus ventricosus]|uniref:Uncharacterized protein n=1 Tax=Araneus ventricosus TaxID=182803 RepID=A0A4Y2AEM1_ARAVE|nr:hypothetical protein AVEN_132151-1 [Araneus ventricosus]